MKIVYRLISVIVGILFIYTIYTFILKKEQLSILPYLENITPWKLVFSLLAYLFSHFLRSLRIAIMIGRQDFSLISLISKQFYTNGINLILPFKLGEVYRIVEFNKIFKDPERTFLTIVAERSIDFIFLFSGLFAALYITEYNILDLKVTLFIGCVFIASVLFIYYVLPENIRWLKLFLAKRYNKNWLIKVLATTHRLYSVIINIKLILKRKLSTIILLTTLIWFAEIAGLFFITDYLTEWPYLLLLSFFVFLSSLIPSGSLGLGALQFAFYLIYLIKPDLPHFALSLVYQFFIFLPAILISFGIYIYSRLNLLRPFRKVITLK